MLAELFLLHRNLRLQGLGVARVHRDFGSPGLKGRLSLQVKLDRTGCVRQLCLLPPDIEPGLWTLKSGNHSYFPATRTDKTPLLRLSPDDVAWIRVERQPSAALVADLSKSAASADAQLDLRAVAQKQATRIAAWPVAPDDRLHKHLRDFAHGFQAFAADPAHAAAELLSGIERAVTTGSDPRLFATLAAVIVGQHKKAKGKASAKAHVEYGAQLLFDFWSDDEPSFSLYSHAVREAVLDALLTQEHGSSAQSMASGLAQQGTCALSGEQATLLRAPFPGWSAKPAISKSLRPFDKFSAAPCNFRYQCADSKGFDIGEATANTVVGALTTVTEEAMRGKTWRPLKNGITASNGMEQSDVLVAYPSCSIVELQNEPMPGIVDVLGESEAAGDDQVVALRKSFEDAAEPVCAAFARAIAREAAAQRIAPDLQILLIRQVSSGQIQIAYSAQPKLALFVDAVKANGTYFGISAIAGGA